MNPYLLYAVDLVVAYLGINVGVLAVASVLASSSIAAGLGLGLFGVLSIIRLRSTRALPARTTSRPWPSESSVAWARRPSGSASPAPP